MSAIDSNNYFKDWWIIAESAYRASSNRTEGRNRHRMMLQKGFNCKTSDEDGFYDESDQKHHLWISDSENAQQEGR